MHFAEGLNHEVRPAGDSLKTGLRAGNVTNFTAAKPKAKLVAHLARLIRRQRLDYGAFERLRRDARKETGLRRTARRRQLPRVLPESTLRSFYEAVDRRRPQAQIMLRLLFYTAVRVSWLIRMNVSEVDLETGKIFNERERATKTDTSCSPNRLG